PAGHLGGRVHRGEHEGPARRRPRRDRHRGRTSDQGPRTMITKMTGVLTRVLDDEARVQVGPFEYQVMIPETVRRQLHLRTGREVTFHTSEYLEGNAGGNRFVPRRVGFLSEAELEFFDLFCTVDKIGVKKALKAMARSIKEIA